LLTACIVYVQGSAGNLVARSLTLDPDTAPYGKAITAKERLEEYNNWNSDNWSLSEKHLNINYVRGEGNFTDYEQSTTKLVQRLHPIEFLIGEQTLWTGDYKWKNLIFIQPNDISTITRLAASKRNDLNHKSQIKEELETYKKLLPQATYTLPFTDLLDKSKFCNHIQSLCETIDVKYYQDYVKQIWTKWYNETCKLI